LGTALLVAVGLALPGVAAYLLRPKPAPPTEVTRLEERLTEHASEARPVHQSQTAALRATLEDTRRPSEERSAAALTLLDTNTMRAHWATVVRDAERIAPLDLPPFQGRLPAEQAALRRLDALSRLEQFEQVLKGGEAFLRTYPTSAQTPVVDALMRITASRRTEDARNRRETQALLRKMEEESAQKLARLEQRGEPTTETRQERDFRRCNIPAITRLHAEAATACRAYVDAWGLGTTADDRRRARQARNSEIISLVGLRHYPEARERLGAFRVEDPGGVGETNAETVVLTIPPDLEE
jgi:hypothetical protein